MMVAGAPPFRVFVLGMAFSFYDRGDSWSDKLSKSLAIIAYLLEELATEHGGCRLLSPLLGRRKFFTKLPLLGNISLPSLVIPFEISNLKF